jgi:hypothetical protein
LSLSRLTGFAVPVLVVEPAETQRRYYHTNPTSITLLTASRMFVLLQRSFFTEERDWKRIQGIVDAKVQEVIE